MSHIVGVSEISEGKEYICYRDFWDTCFMSHIVGMSEISEGR